MFTDMHCTAMDNAGITATSCGSGAERVLWHEYHAATLRDESLTPGPQVSFPRMGQPMEKGKEQAAGKRPMQSPERHPNETGVMRAMERMEHRLHAAMQSGLNELTCSVSLFETRMANVEEHTASSKIDEQEDVGPLESDLWERPLPDAYPSRGREPRYSSLRFDSPRFELLWSRPAPA